MAITKENVLRKMYELQRDGWTYITRTKSGFVFVTNLDKEDLPDHYDFIFDLESGFAIQGEEECANVILAAHETGKLRISLEN
jgi:hypothetical protein